MSNSKMYLCILSACLVSTKKRKVGYFTEVNVTRSIVFTFRKLTRKSVSYCPNIGNQEANVQK